MQKIQERQRACKNWVLHAHTAYMHVYTHALTWDVRCKGHIEILTVVILVDKIRGGFFTSSNVCKCPFVVSIILKKLQLWKVKLQQRVRENPMVKLLGHLIGIGLTGSLVTKDYFWHGTWQNALEYDEDDGPPQTIRRVEQWSLFATTQDLIRISSFGPWNLGKFRELHLGSYFLGIGSLAWFMVQNHPV